MYSLYLIYLIFYVPQTEYVFCNNNNVKKRSNDERKGFIQMRVMTDKSLCTTQQYNHRFLRKKTTRSLENTIYDYINLYRTLVSTSNNHCFAHMQTLNHSFLSFILYIYIYACFSYYCKDNSKEIEFRWHISKILTLRNNQSNVCVLCSRPG